jgi:hypothetical protein
MRGVGLKLWRRHGWGPMLLACALVGWLAGQVCNLAGAQSAGAPATVYAPIVYSFRQGTVTPGPDKTQAAPRAAGGN